MISVVVPVYNEEKSLRELVARVTTELERTGEHWEFIVVNDGSVDGSGRLLREMRSVDPRLKVIQLSRNFGHQQALTAGVDSARGDCVITIDGDLQDPPEVIPDLIAKWKEGYQVVFAERRSRKDHGLRSMGFRAFYPMFRQLSDLPAAQQAGVFGLMDRVVVAEFNKLVEGNRFIPGLRSWLGFKQTGILYDRAERSSGNPKQQLRHLVKYAIDGIFSFSYKPLRAATYMGFVVSLIAFTLTVVSVVAFLVLHRPVTGVTSVIIDLFLGGVQLICVGILGEYIGRIYEEVKRRPLYVIEEKLGFD
jgi:dolichol-phosphate mannosyltransferase